jgi:replicative DNA helicase
MTSFSKNAPRSDRAERCLIGAVLISEELFPNLIGRVKPEDFYALKHSKIWEAMLEIFNEGKEVSLVSLSQKATQDSSSAYLAQCMNEVPSTRYYNEWVEEILNASRKRAVLFAAGKIAAAVYEEDSAVDVEDRARAILDSLIQTDAQESLLTPEKQAEILREYIEERKESNSQLVRTGFPTLDMNCGGGFRRGDLIIIAARTSVGKSTYAENIAENVAKSGHRVLFVSVEMTPKQMLYRYAVRSGTLSESTLEYGIDSDSEDGKVTELQELRKGMPFFIFDAPTATVPLIRAQVSRLNAQGKLGLVVVDYLQLLADSQPNAKNPQEHLRIGQITKSLKHLAREFDVPIILISQLNRNLEYRGGEPKLADLRESGRIEEDADLVLMLWELEEPDLLGNATRLKIAKNRQGPQGLLPIYFNKPHFTFGEPHHAE